MWIEFANSIHKHLCMPVGMKVHRTDPSRKLALTAYVSTDDLMDKKTD